MMNFRLFYLSIALIAVQIPTISFAQKSDKSIKIGLIADIQYANKPSSGTRFYRASLPKLEACVDSLNQQKTNLNIVFGDLVDEGPKDLQPILDRLNKLDSAHFNILGNHDYPSNNFDNNLFKTYKMPAPYYRIIRDDWVILFLNTNELSKYAVNKKSNQSKELDDMMENLKSEQRKNATSYNGGISKKQLNYLIDQLQYAKKKQLKVIVCCHHPLYPENGLEALNNREILEVLQKANQVKAVIAGHHHAGNFALYKDLPIITLEGMVETEKENAFGILELKETSMTIKGYGLLTSRTLNYR